MAEQRPWWSNIYWVSRDYLKRVWDNASEDNVLFLAGGIAFNILLAALPFTLLLIAGMTYLAPRLFRVGPVDAVNIFIDRLMPLHSEEGGSTVHAMIAEVVRTRNTIPVYSAFLFAWLSTRLFGSLRTALADVFDIENERSIIRGKIFDVEITIVATVLFVASTVASTYIILAASRGLGVLGDLGLRPDLQTDAEYWMGRGLSFVFITMMFFALYKYLPVRQVRVRTALLAAVFSGLLFELAKVLFRVLIRGVNPQSIYSGTVAALVIIVAWVYYAALIFLIGGEVGQVYELRRTRKLQREVFT